MSNPCSKPHLQEGLPDLRDGQGQALPRPAGALWAVLESFKLCRQPTTLRLVCCWAALPPLHFLSNTLRDLFETPGLTLKCATSAAMRPFSPSSAASSFPARIVWWTIEIRWLYVLLLSMLIRRSARDKKQEPRAAADAWCLCRRRKMRPLQRRNARSCGSGGARTAAADTSDHPRLLNECTRGLSSVLQVSERLALPAAPALAAGRPKQRRQVRRRRCCRAAAAALRFPPRAALRMRPGRCWSRRQPSLHLRGPVS